MFYMPRIIKVKKDFLCFKNLGLGAPEQLNWLTIQLLTSVQVMITVQETVSHVRLCTDSIEPAWDSFFPSLPLSLSAPPLLALSLSQK